jgi:hypothetical protein
MIFTNISNDQVNCTHNLLKFLRRLRAIGFVETAVGRVEISRETRYHLQVVGYQPKLYVTPMEAAMEELDRLGFGID